MSKTIKQIADELGVSKTAVRKKIENLGLRSGLQKNGNQFAIDDKQEKLIKSCFFENKSETANREPVCEKTETFPLVSDLVSVLKEQLEEKDRQIAEKDKQIESLQKALVLAQENIKGAQLLQANAEQKLLEQKDESKSEVLEKGKGFWAKFLGK